jgi:hypothetical protein
VGQRLVFPGFLAGSSDMQRRHGALVDDECAVALLSRRYSWAMVGLQQVLSAVHPGWYGPFFSRPLGVRGQRQQIRHPILNENDERVTTAMRAVIPVPCVRRGAAGAERYRSSRSFSACFGASCSSDSLI